MGAAVLSACSLCSTLAGLSRRFAYGIVLRLEALRPATNGLSAARIRHMAAAPAADCQKAIAHRRRDCLAIVPSLARSTVRARHLLRRVPVLDQPLRPFTIGRADRSPPATAG
jgi:hypothetical protein